MSYTFVVDWNIRLKKDTPKEIIDTLDLWHKKPYDYDHVLKDHGIDVHAALGGRDEEGYGGLIPETDFEHKPGEHPMIRTSATFSRRSEGVNRLDGFLHWLVPYIDNVDEVLGIIRGEDDIYCYDDYPSGWFSDAPVVPRKTYFEVRIKDGRADYNYTRGDLHGNYPWAQRSN